MYFKKVFSRTGKKIALAILALLCGLASIIGGCNLKSANTIVYADDGTESQTEFSSATDLFQSTNVTMAFADLGETGQGLKIQQSADNIIWKAAFNGVFHGDFSMEYLLENPTGWSRLLVITFKTIDGTELFKIQKGSSGNNGTYEDGSSYNQTTDWINIIKIFVGEEEKASSINARPYMNTDIMGNLSVSWTDSGAVIGFTKSSSPTTLATLSGVMLPTDGYIVEISSLNGDQAAKMILMKLNGISVVGGKVNTQTVGSGLGLSAAREVTYIGKNENSEEFQYSGTQFVLSSASKITLAPTYTGNKFEIKYSIPTINTGAANSGIVCAVEDSSGNEILKMTKYWEQTADVVNAGVGGTNEYLQKMKVSHGESSTTTKGCLPYLGQENTLGKVTIEFSDNKLIVYNSNVLGNNNVGWWGWDKWEERKICTIADVAKPENGYKISFAGLNASATILINSINGEECTGVVADVDKDFSVDISAAGESVNESGVAALNLKRGANPFTATVKNAKFAGITLNEYTKSVDISSLDLSADKTAGISYLGVTKEYAVNVYDYVVTLKDGEAETKQYLESTETVTFVAGAQSDKIFIGYANGSSLYGVNSAYTPTEDIIFNATYIDFAMHTGASVRKQTDEKNQYGMRFLAGIAETDLETYGGFITETGVLILPEDLRAGKEITLDNFSAENKEILKIANEGNEFAKGVKVKDFEDYGVYTGVITSILPANINRKFSARGYAVITYSDNTTAIIYTAFSVENNSRSAYEVAKSAKEHGETGAALDYYISAVDGNN